MTGSQPAPRGYTPRTTTRGDVRIADVRPTQTDPDLVPNSTGVRASSPAPVGGSIRPVGGSVRDVGGKPAAPTAHDLYGRTSPGTPGVKSAPIDHRYTPTKPYAPTDVTPKILDKTRPSAHPKGLAISDRYPTRANPTATLSPAPKALIAPDAGSPRLQPRSSISASVGRYSPTSSYCKPHASNTWNCWWDPCGSYSHCYSGCWGLYGGSGCYGWGLSYWYPWYHCHNSCWNSGYSSCYWNSCCGPYYPSWNYWWYPSSTYCPSYLYVPSSVVVVESGYASSGGEEVLGAGHPVGGSVKVEEHGAGDRNQTANDLAKKYVELGDFYFKAGRFAEAEDTYARARTYAPDDASIHFVLADAAFAKGDYHFAAFLIAEALRLDPAMASANTDKRLFYGDQKLFEEQMAQLDKYLTEKPYDASAHLVRGYNLRFSDKPAAAIAAFRRVLEIAPEQPAAHLFLAALEPAKAEEPAKR